MRGILTAVVVLATIHVHGSEPGEPLDCTDMEFDVPGLTCSTFVPTEVGDWWHRGTNLAIDNEGRWLAVRQYSNGVGDSVEVVRFDGVREQRLVEIIRDLRESSDPTLSVKNITAWFEDRHGEEYDRKVTAKWIGWVIRRKLRLRTQKRNGVFVVADTEGKKLERLMVRIPAHRIELKGHTKRRTTTAPDPAKTS